MAHFAEVDDNGNVTQVIVVRNEACGGGTFPASEPIGQAFINGPHPDGLGLNGNWLQTSYSGAFRGCFAGLAWSYDPVANVFMPPAAPDALAP